MVLEWVGGFSICFRVAPSPRQSSGVLSKIHVNQGPPEVIRTHLQPISAALVTEKILEAPESFGIAERPPLLSCIPASLGLEIGSYCKLPGARLLDLVLLPRQVLLWATLFLDLVPRACLESLLFQPLKYPFQPLYTRMGSYHA